MSSLRATESPEPAAVSKRVSILTLYQLAQDKSWQVRALPDWPGESARRGFPVAAEANPFAGYAEYERLPRAQRIDFAWQLHAQDITDILWGEQAALTLSAQLLAAADDEASRLFLASQVNDEARHVEFFSRYLKQTVGLTRPPGAALRSYTTAAIATESQRDKLIACQLVLENLALVKFTALRRATHIPLLSQALTRISQDESRHLRFGTEGLRLWFASLSGVRRQCQLERLRASLLSLADQSTACLEVGRHCGFDTQRLRQHLRLRRVRDRRSNRQLRRRLTHSLGPELASELTLSLGEVDGDVGRH